jgi:hypothetical protein
METPSAVVLLDTWERGQQRGPAHRGLFLLQAAFPDVPGDQLADIPIGGRNRLLLALRARLFGLDLEGVTVCKGCGETLEAQLPLPPENELAPIPPANIHDLSCDGTDIRYRLPTTADIMKLPACELDVAVRWLLLRCIVGVTHDGVDEPASALPLETAERVARALSESDPDGVVELIVTCPHCEESTAVQLDPATFLWDEVDQWAWRVVGEVHDLATAYGWSESEILAMTPWRRQAYLELLPA